MMRPFPPKKLTTILTFLLPLLYFLPGLGQVRGEDSVNNLGAAPSYPLTDHYNGEVFFNYDPDPKTFWDFLQWRWSRTPGPWPENADGPRPAPPADPVVERVEKGFRVTWIGHATTLVQMENINILTDPILSERASPVGFAGPQRAFLPAVNLDQLPPIDLVVIGHDHFDHCDLPTIEALQKKFNPLFLVGLKMSHVIGSIPGIRFKEMDWFEQYTLAGLHLTFLPTQHWSKRHLFGMNETLWGSFLITSINHGTNVYFASDTGFGPQFEKIVQFMKTLSIPSLKNKKYPLSLAILPIGSYEPRWFMKYAHLNPEETVKVATMLGAKYALPMHYQTFQLADEGFQQPEKELLEALAGPAGEAYKAEPLRGEFKILPMGKSFSAE